MQRIRNGLRGDCSNSRASLLRQSHCCTSGHRPCERTCTARSIERWQRRSTTGRRCWRARASTTRQFHFWRGRASSIRRKKLGENHLSTVGTQNSLERVRKHVREHEPN